MDTSYAPTFTNNSLGVGIQIIGLSHYLFSLPFPLSFSHSLFLTQLSHFSLLILNSQFSLLTLMLRVAYVPEHFLTPLFFAQQQNYYAEAGIQVSFIPVIEGTGRLVRLLSDGEVDIAIGLTEGFIADVAKGNDAYKVVGTYVESPLCWAVSTGASRNEITSTKDVLGKKIGVSRIGSGSYIMSFVLGLELGATKPFFSDFPVLSNFANLRQSVNDGSSDAFMWEYFTTKKYYDNHELKQIGEIYTPWPLWVITARRDVDSTQLTSFVASVARGIDYFNSHHDEAVAYISTNLDYSEEDARKWLTTVRFSSGLGSQKLDWDRVVTKTASVLQTAGVLTDSDEVITERLRNGVEN